MTLKDHLRLRFCLVLNRGIWRLRAIAPFSRFDMRLRLEQTTPHAGISIFGIYTWSFFDRLSDLGYHFCENMGYNLLVFTSSTKHLAFYFLCFALLRAWTAAGRLHGRQNPWVDPVPHFPKIGRLTAPVGYICWDFLFYVAVGLSGWTKWQDPFDDFS